MHTTRHTVRCVRCTCMHCCAAHTCAAITHYLGSRLCFTMENIYNLIPQETQVVHKEFK